MKKALKRSLSLLLAITIIFSSAYVGLSEVDFSGLFTVKAEAANSGTYKEGTWTLDDEGTLTIEDVEAVDGMYEEMPWYGLRNSIRDIVLKSGIKTIENVPFYDASNVISITIPDTVTHFDTMAIAGCTNLEQIIVDENNINYFSDDGVIYRRDLPYSTYSLLKYPSAKPGLEYEIYENTTFIGYYAFSGCGLISITIPESVNRMNSGAFDNCLNLENVYITNLDSWCNIDFFEYNSNPLQYASNLYVNGKLTTDIAISDGVTIIRNFAFYSYDKLTAVTIPDSVTSIGDSAFDDCTSLTDVYYGGTQSDWENITIGSDNSCLTNATIHFRVLNYELNSDGESYYISDCDTSATGEVVIPSTYNGLPVTGIGEEAFRDCDSLTSVIIPDTVLSVGECAFYNCDSLVSVDLGEGLESLGDNAFSYCKSIQSITIPDSVTSLGEAPFIGCDSISYLKIGSGLESFSYLAFAFCDSLTSVTIPSNLESTSEEAFYGCANLETVIISHGVTEISPRTFKNCEKLTSVTIPDSIRNIGDSAFDGSDSLTDVYYAGTEADWADISIGGGNEALTNATIHYHEHSFSGDWIIDVEPTCTQTGSKHKTCLSCGNVVTENIPAIGHNYSTDWIIDVEPTCTEEGSKSHHCTVCGDKADVTVIGALGHSYSEEWTIDVEPTQSSEGEKSRHCESCSDRTDITVIPRLVNESVAYVETDGVLCNGEITYIVKLKAGDKLEGAIFGAVFDPDVLEPVDEKSGGYIITDSYGDEVLSVNGMYVVGMKNGSEDTYVVGHINMTELDIASDTEYMVFTFRVKDFSASEATVDFYCVEFNGTPEIEHNDYEVVVSCCSNEIKSYDHTISADWKIEKEADAAEEGLQYKDCTLCGEVLETAVIPQTVCEKPVIASVEQTEGGLVVTWDSVHGADLYDLYRKTDSNWVKISQLASENTTYTDVDVVNDTEYSYAVKAINEVGESQLSDVVSKVYHVHTMGDWVVRTAPTCTEYGESYRKCTGCEYEETDVIEPKGHSYSLEWTIDLEPNCTEEGSKSHHCTACGDKTDVTSIDSLGHHYDDGVVTKPATCEEDGVIAFTCTRKGCTDSYIYVIPAIGHAYDSGKVVLTANCEEDGTMRYSCQNEGCYSYYDEVIVKLGHNMDKGTVVKEPTCISEGEKIYKCYNAGCQHTVIEVIEMADHSYSDVWTIDVEATCTEPGSKSHHCTVCGDKADITEIVAIGHNYVLTDTLSAHPHTVTYICSACDDEKTQTTTQIGCIECNFTITPVDLTGYKLVSYYGNQTDVVIPAKYNGRDIISIANACFRGNTSIKSVKIADGVTSIGSLAFMNCGALERVYIPSSVTSIGAQAFYGFTGTIYCVTGSVAHEYAVANNISYVLVSITETERTEIDYDNFVIRTTIQECGDITEILGVSETAIAIPTASYIYGNLELYGTGTVITVFDGNEYIGDFTLVVEGDINGDSVCDVLDASQVALVSNGHKTLDGAYAMAADSNSDDMVDVTDYQSIVNKVVA